MDNTNSFNGGVILSLKAKSNYITPDQFESMINFIPELRIRKWKDLDVEYAFKIAYYSALRLGAEVADRTKEDFDLERQEIFLGKTKTSLNDYAPIAPPFIPELKLYLSGKAPLEPILKDCDAQNMYKWLMKMGEELKIEALITPQSITGEKTKLHIFRKSMLKDMFYGTFGMTANIGQAQSQARHKNPMTTGRYLRLDGEGAKEYWNQRKDN